MRMWMGQWTPQVFSFSSNWKELKTLLLTMQHLATLDPAEVEGTTLFYFTDNSTTYWVMKSGSSRSPELHKLVEETLLLAMSMAVYLQVVHVPGRIMIDQGTDGLSRGVWASPLHDLWDPTLMNQAVFAPLPVDMNLAEHYARQAGSTEVPRLHLWDRPWGSVIFDHLSVWFPPPELARTCLIGILEAWVERPHTTSALVFVPRVLAGSWMGLCRFIQEIDVIYPHLTPIPCPPLLSIPIVVLYLPPHSRMLPSSRIDPPPFPRGRAAHVKEATYVRGLGGK